MEDSCVTCVCFELSLANSNIQQYLYMITCSIKIYCQDLHCPCGSSSPLVITAFLGPGYMRWAGTVKRAGSQNELALLHTLASNQPSPASGLLILESEAGSWPHFFGVF